MDNRKNQGTSAKVPMKIKPETVIQKPCHTELRAAEQGTALVRIMLDAETTHLEVRGGPMPSLCQLHGQHKMERREKKNEQAGITGLQRAGGVCHHIPTHAHPNGVQRYKGAWPTHLPLSHPHTEVKSIPFPGSPPPQKLSSVFLIQEKGCRANRASLIHKIPLYPHCHTTSWQTYASYTTALFFFLFLNTDISVLPINHPEWDPRCVGSSTTVYQGVCSQHLSGMESQEAQCLPVPAVAMQRCSPPLKVCFLSSSAPAFPFERALQDKAKHCLCMLVELFDAHFNIT